MVKPVAIYADDGVSEVGITSLQIAVSQYLQCPSRLITAEQILQGELEYTSVLIMPGGADLPYCHKLNGKGNQLIQQFVSYGGLYLGICAGAYYACKQIEFIGQEYCLFEKRELAFFDGLAKGCLPQFTNGNYYNEEANSKAMIPIHFIDNKKYYFYYHGGCTFIPNSNACYQILATYPDDTPAIIKGKYGKGTYFLSGVHFELQSLVYKNFLLKKSLSAQEHFLEQKIVKYLDGKYGENIWKNILNLIK